MLSEKDIEERLFSEIDLSDFVICNDYIQISRTGIEGMCDNAEKTSKTKLQEAMKKFKEHLHLHLGRRLTTSRLCDICAP
jgi:hypothetical protein